MSGSQCVFVFVCVSQTQTSTNIFFFVSLITVWVNSEKREIFYAVYGNTSTLLKFQCVIGGRNAIPWRYVSLGCAIFFCLILFYYPRSAKLKQCVRMSGKASAASWMDSHSLLFSSAHYFSRSNCTFCRFMYVVSGGVGCRGAGPELAAILFFRTRNTSRLTH